MNPCEAWEPDDDGLCIWCRNERRKHAWTVCEDCLGYGYLYRTDRGIVPAVEIGAGEPVACESCWIEGKGSVGFVRNAAQSKSAA